MIIDYSKKEFTLDEQRHIFKETERLKQSNPNHIPVLIQIDSNILKMDKQKFLISNDINIHDFISGTLKKKLINFYNDDLSIKIIKFNTLQQIKLPTSSLMKDIYDEYKDTHTNLLILRVSRKTTYKWIKKYARYLLG